MGWGGVIITFRIRGISYAYGLSSAEALLIRAQYLLEPGKSVWVGLGDAQSSS